MQKANSLKTFVGSKLFWPFAALILILLFNLLFTPGFFSLEIKDGHLFGSLIDILNRGAALMVLSMGMTLAVATGGVDLSVGPMIAITAAVAATLIGPETDVTATPLALVILAALAIAVLGGAWNGMLVSRGGIQPIVATLILMVAGRGIAQLITEGQILTIYYSPYYFIGAGYLFGLPFPLFIVIGMLLFFWVLTRKTALGLFIESLGINASASYHSGVNAKNIKLLLYVLSGLCAGVAGLMISSNIKSADANNAGQWAELDAILAVNIGGTVSGGGRFYLFGSLLGALIIQTLTTTIYSVGVPPEIVLVVKAGVILVVTLIQSEEFRQIVAGKFFTKKEAAR
jgi:simple sugar transport system permease protein